jgi:hypothetical protein
VRKNTARKAHRAAAEICTLMQSVSMAAVSCILRRRRNAHSGRNTPLYRVLSAISRYVVQQARQRGADFDETSIPEPRWAQSSSATHRRSFCRLLAGKVSRLHLAEETGDSEPEHCTTLPT